MALEDMDSLFGKGTHTQANLSLNGVAEGSENQSEDHAVGEGSFDQERPAHALGEDEDQPLLG